MSMSADDRKTLGSMLQFYVDTGDSIRHVPNPAAFYSGQIAITAAGGITADGLVTITAIAAPLLVGQQFYYLGVLYTLVTPAAAGATTFSVTPRPGAPLITAAPVTTSIFTPLNLTNNGLGETNNVISKSTLFDPRNGYQALNGLVNEGRRARMQDTSYSPSALQGTYQNAAAAGQIFKNHIVQNDDDAVVYNMFAVLPMATLHNFFEKLPIIRGLSVRLNLYLNTGITINSSVTKVNHVAITSSVIPRQTVPFMVSPISNDPVCGSGLSIDTAVSLQYQLKIGNSTLSTCRFYENTFYCVKE